MPSQLPPYTPHGVARALCRGLTSKGMEALAIACQEAAQAAEREHLANLEAEGALPFAPGAGPDIAWLSALADAVEERADRAEQPRGAPWGIGPKPCLHGLPGGAVDRGSRCPNCGQVVPLDYAGPGYAGNPMPKRDLPRLAEAASQADLADARLRWEKVEEQAAASGDLARLANARAMLRRMGRVD